MSKAKLTRAPDGTFYVGFDPLRLSPARTALLGILWDQQNLTVPFDALHVDPQTLKVQICHIRRALRQSGVTSHTLETTLGTGYRLVHSREA